MQAMKQQLVCECPDMRLNFTNHCFRQKGSVGQKGREGLCACQGYHQAGYSGFLYWARVQHPAANKSAACAAVLQCSRM